MNKLGLKITRVSQGRTVLLTVNDGEWAKAVVDIRDVLNLYEPASDKFAMFMSFGVGGTYITLARFITGRDLDYIDGWVFVPNTVDIDGKTLVGILDMVMEELLKTQIDGSILKRIFEHSYPEVMSVPFEPSATENVYAVRDLDKNRLEDIIGRDRYQSYYSGYKKIFLCGQSTLGIAPGNKVTDISSKTLFRSVLVSPPDMSKLDHGVTVSIAGRNALFTSPVRWNVGEKMSLVFERHGFDPIEHTCLIDEQTQACSLPPVMDWRYWVNRDRFYVYALHSGEDLSSSAAITVNGKVLSLPIELTEREAKNAKIRIEARGFLPFELERNLLHDGVVECGMNREAREQRWTVELANGKDAEMTLVSKDLDISSDSCPLRGYSINEKGKLGYNGAFKERAIGFAIASSLALIVLCVSAVCSWTAANTLSFTSEFPFLKAESRNAQQINASQNYVPEPDDGAQAAPSPTADNEEVEPQQSDSGVNPVEAQRLAAIEYLDGNDVWHKDSLESYPVLQGLFDEMNTYNFSAIIDRSVNLGDSEKFNEILEALPLTGGRNTFNRDGDLEITLARYIEKLIQIELRNGFTGNSGGSSQTSVQDDDSNRGRENINR